MGPSRHPGQGTGAILKRKPQRWIETEKEMKTDVEVRRNDAMDVLCFDWRARILGRQPGSA